MIRNIDLKEISDGRLYTANDMVKTDCHNCDGCFACCKGMGESIVLDPLDIHRLCLGLNIDFSQLLKEKIELNIVDGLTLPNLKMKEVCGFLNEKGRCSVHEYRPGICRMFPLGRVYEEEGFKYFLQVNECPAKNKGKIKVKKWIGIAETTKYEEYIWQWHLFLKSCREGIRSLDEEQIRILNMLILKTFYQKSYKKEFYQDFYGRLNETRKILGII